jgi:acetate kinase
MRDAHRGGDTVLVVNAGSSSLKLRVLDAQDDTLASIDLAADRPAEVQETVRGLLSRFAPGVVGHRVVHGGTRFDGPVLVDGEVRAALTDLVELAPLHQPAALSAIDLVLRLAPQVPSVACFDTAFHRTMPAAAHTYALPQEWSTRYPLRRFGFHGLSHAYASKRVAELIGRDVADLRTVVCHLGAGASLCAVKSGRSVDTTMGFTPLDGLVMATRPGSLDPGLLLWLQRHRGLTVDQLDEALEKRSGLLGLAGSADLKALVEAREDDPRAGLAVEVYLHRLVGSVAAMAASMGGLDALVFTAGVGERSAFVRSQVSHRLGFLGVAVDETANGSGPPDRDLTSTGARVQTWVLAAREDLEIARAARALVR